MPAPKGNKFGLGHGFGRPPLYETPEQMVPLIKEYFDLVTSSSGVCKPTISGLVYHLGFESRDAWYKYLKKEGFGYILRRTQLFLESCYEANLHGYNWAGSAFALKNMNPDHWKDQTEQKQTMDINATIKADFGTTIQPTQEPENNT